MGFTSATCGNRSLGMMEWQVLSRTRDRGQTAGRDERFAD